MNFEFATANRIIFGSGKIREVSRIAAGLGRRIFLVRGKHVEGLESFFQDLEDAGFVVTPYHVTAEPDIECIETGRQSARAANCQVVIAVGGGSILDSGKAIAALATNDRPVMDYLEVVGQGLPLEKPALPVIAVPTTAGTGSEVTRNAVITVRSQRVKVSLRSPSMLPRVAVVDPALTLTLPPAVTASSGMDALTQVLEPFVSCKANVMVDLFCQEGLSCAAGSLLRAYQHGDDLAAREKMAWASLLGGLALANAGLGAVHGFAGPLGGLYTAPHGALCAALLAPVVRVNVRALMSRQPENPALARYEKIARLLTADANATLEQGIRWLEAISRALQIPGLGAYGISSADFSLIAAKAAASSSMKGNPLALTPQELVEILEMAL